MLQKVILYLSILGCISGCTVSLNQIRNSNLNLGQTANTTYRVDHKASELIIDHNIGNQSPPEHVKSELSYAIESLLNQNRLPHSKSPLIRYRIEVTQFNRNLVWALFPCLYVLIYFGCPVAKINTQIKISLEMQGWIYSTQVQDSIYMGVYYNQGPFVSFEKGVIKGFKKLIKIINQHTQSTQASLHRSLSPDSLQVF